MTLDKLAQGEAHCSPFHATILLFPTELPMIFTPHLSSIPYLKVPENRVNLAYAWYLRNTPHPNNFAAYSYWIEKCDYDGSEY